MLIDLNLFIYCVAVNKCVCGEERFFIVTAMVFQFEGKKRISADEAMRHSYFHCLGERVLTLPDSKCAHTHTHTLE